MLKKLIFALVLTMQIGAIAGIAPQIVPPPRCFPCGN